MAERYVHLFLFSRFLLSKQKTIECLLDGILPRPQRLFERVNEEDHEKTSLALVACLVAIGLLAFTYKIVPGLKAVTTQGGEHTPMPLAFPKQGPEYTSMLQAIQFTSGPGFKMDGPPSAIYGKSMTLKEAQALIEHAPVFEDRDENSMVWVTVFEGKFIINLYCITTTRHSKYS